MQQFGPSRCFNGYHVWYLNWYADRRLEIVNPWNASLVELATFVDCMSTQPYQYVVIKVDVFYLIYNRAKGVNNGTEEAKNQVRMSSLDRDAFWVDRSD
jgi:hypothetical protein